MLDELSEDGFLDFSVLLHCGVYALARKGTVVYVGKSTTLNARIYRHCHTRGKNPTKNSYYGTSLYKGMMFDSIWILPCMLSELSLLEARMIRKYQPKFNVKLKGGAEMPPEIRAMIERMSAVKEVEPAPLFFNRRGL